eukprot:CAMPEP_0201899738 /NCGR_PEP_ID=MMETSP0902-20130614/51009_1 /ASSEMBLY_ACC=CAM_ASM_000551 /TAXON_ID=420261 /ORGANISM="Thalassiosira antarctica, Strain CCMP982" /LENGTH=180 /DNA_ID=CAMNT_0048433223 /DNA_START=123 /DNA_END=661 /DNA_ORIENTATION=+
MIVLAPFCLCVCSTNAAATRSKSPQSHNFNILASASMLANKVDRHEKFEQSYSSIDGRSVDPLSSPDSTLFSRVFMHKLTKTCGVRLHTRWYTAQVLCPSISSKSAARQSSSRRQNSTANLVVRFPATDAHRSNIAPGGNGEEFLEFSLADMVCSRIINKKSLNPDVWASSDCKALEQYL